MIFAHIAGVPVEEMLLNFAPIGAVGLGAIGLAARERLVAASRRLLRRRRG
jgi:hypothetical protein